MDAGFSVLLTILFKMVIGFFAFITVVGFTIMFFYKRWIKLFYFFYFNLFKPFQGNWKWILNCSEKKGLTRHHSISSVLLKKISNRVRINEIQELTHSERLCFQYHFLFCFLNKYSAIIDRRRTIILEHFLIP